jgi:nucleoside-triphosphatase
MHSLLEAYPASGSTQTRSLERVVLESGLISSLSLMAYAACSRARVACRAATLSAGAYSVDVASFERLALPTLHLSEPTGNGNRVKARPLVVIDEIGRMELHSERFKEAVRTLLDASDTPVFGAITAPIYGHRVPFCDEIEAHARVHITRITQKVRDDVHKDLQTQLLNRLSGP